MNLNKPTYDDIELKFFEDAWTGSIPLDTYTGSGYINSTADICTNTITLTVPDPLIDWLPYHYKKYLPTWHLVRSYQHE